MECDLSNDLLGRNEVKLFVVPLDVSAGDYAACEHTLNAEELARANRFVFADVRRRFVVCRGQLRTVLAQALNQHPSELKFRYEQWGKPRLVRSVEPHIHFNVSHSSEWALIALAQSPLGVDLEVLNDRISYRAIASQILTGRETQLWNQVPLPERAAATMQLWVCKEPLLKAMGLGIAEGLQQVSFPVPIPREVAFAPTHIDGQLQMHVDDDGSCRANHWIDATSWQLRMLDLIPNSYAAICTPCSIDRLTVLDENYQSLGKISPG